MSDMKSTGSAGPRSPYALIETILQCKVDWSKVRDFHGLLEIIFKMKVKEIIDPGNELSPLYGKMRLNEWMAGLGSRKSQIEELIGGTLFDLEPGESWWDCDHLIRDGIKVTDPLQGEVQNCGLIASLGSIAWVNPGIIERTDIKNGLYILPYYHEHDVDGWHRHEVMLYGKIFLINKLPCGAHSNCLEECWPSLFEKGMSLTKYLDNSSTLMNNHNPFMDPYDPAINSSPENQDVFYDDHVNNYPGNTNGTYPCDALSHLTGRVVKEELTEDIMDNPIRIKIFEKELLEPPNKLMHANAPFPLHWAIPCSNFSEAGIYFSKAKYPIVVRTGTLPHCSSLNINIMCNHAYSFLGILVERPSDETSRVSEIEYDLFDSDPITHIDVLVRNPYGYNDCTTQNNLPGVRYYRWYNNCYLPTYPNKEVMKDGVFGVELKWFTKYFKKVAYICP